MKNENEQKSQDIWKMRTNKRARTYEKWEQTKEPGHTKNENKRKSQDIWKMRTNKRARTYQKWEHTLGKNKQKIQKRRLKNKRKGLKKQKGQNNRMDSTKENKGKSKVKVIISSIDHNTGICNDKI